MIGPVSQVLSDPEWILEKLFPLAGIRLWSRQEEIYRAVFEWPEVYVRTGQACGKTFCAGAVGAAFLISRPRSKVIYVATKLAQAKQQAWGEFLRVYGRLRNVLARFEDFPIELPEPGAETVTVEPGQWFATVYTGREADPETFMGFHAEHLLFVIDEASGVSDSVREAVERCLTSKGSRLLAIGNPLRRSGWFYRGFQDDAPWRKTIHVSALEVPNVIEGKEIIPGLATREWIERQRAEWGEDSPFWQASILGEFPQESEDALISWSSIQEAKARDLEPDFNRLAVGVDVARHGNDSSVICVLAGDVVHELVELRRSSLMELVGRIIEVLRKYDIRRCAVDEIGMGGGVVDRLLEQGVDVEGFNASRKPDDAGRFKNLKAEVAWSLRERFLGGNLAIPNHDRLVNELAAWRYSFDSSGRLTIVDPPKSPDFADALLIAHWMQIKGAAAPSDLGLPRHNPEEWSVDGW